MECIRECKIEAGAEIPWTMEMQRTDVISLSKGEQSDLFLQFPAEIQSIIGTVYRRYSRKPWIFPLPSEMVSWVSIANKRRHTAYVM
jgi:hypothetical protein